MRKSILLILIILMLGGLTQTPSMAEPQSDWLWSELDVLSVESTGNSYSPSMTTDPEGWIHVAWYDYTDYNGSGADQDIFYKSLDPINQTWSTTQVISTESDGSSQVPDILSDNSGNIHLVWQDGSDYDGAGTDKDIFYKMMNATTQTWSTTKVISPESTGGSHFPELAITADGLLHICWYDYSDYNGAGADADIFYRSLDLNTQSLSTLEIMTVGSDTQSFSPSIASDNLGNVHLTWYDYYDYSSGGSTDADIYYKKLDYTTNTWNYVELISEVSDFASIAPSITTDNIGRIHIVWYDSEDYNGAGTQPDIFYRSWDQEWGETEVISKGAFGAYDPVIISDSASNIHVVWYDYEDYNGAGPAADIFYINKVLGSDWSTRHVINTNTGSANAPVVGLDNSQFVHILWRDTANYTNAGTDADIFYTKLSGLPQAPVLEDILPNPSNGIINLEWDEVFSATSYSIYRDIYPIHSVEGLTAIAETSNSFYVDEVDTGTYYYAITANNIEGSSLSNMVYVQVGMDIQTIINTDIVTETADGGFIDYPLSVPLLFTSLTIVVIIQRKKRS